MLPQIANPSLTEEQRHGRRGCTAISTGDSMRKYYYVIEQDDLWYIRVRGKIYGGYLVKEQALRHAINSAQHSAAEAYVVVHQPGGDYRVEWANSKAANGHHVGASLQMQPAWRPVGCLTDFPKTRRVVRLPQRAGDAAAAAPAMGDRMSPPPPLVLTKPAGCTGSTTEV